MAKLRQVSVKRERGIAARIERGLICIIWRGEKATVKDLAHNASVGTRGLCAVCRC